MRRPTTGARSRSRARSKLLAGGEDVDAVLEALSRGLTQKMLHGTLAELRAADGDEREQLAQTVSRLFLRQQRPRRRRRQALATLRSRRLRAARRAPRARHRSCRRPHESLPPPAVRTPRPAPRRARRDCSPTRSVAADMKRYRELAASTPKRARWSSCFAATSGASATWRRPRELLAESAGDADDGRDGRRGGRTPRAPTSSALRCELQAALLPRDPDDARNVFLEIRAGTGGDESALFAADLARMYLRFAERQRWQTEVMSESASDLGGYKEVVFRIEGDARLRAR